MTQLCICHSGKAHAQCCAPLLSGKRVAKTPVQLMRSRFSAYALGGYGDYLLKTWHPSQSHALNANELSIKSINWLHLEILSKDQKGDQGLVEFKASYQNEGHELIHHERSSFKRVNGEWLYVTGDIFES